MKNFLAVIAALCVGVFSSVVAAQSYPDKPIKFVVPLGPGSGLDAGARYVAERISKTLGQPVIVENRPGAGSLIGTEYVLKAPADGYMVLLVSPSSMVINPLTRPNNSYDPLKDFTMVAGMNLANIVVVVPASSPHQTFKDFVEYGRQNPGKINFGHYSEFYRLGSISLLKNVGVEANYIPYQSATPVISDLAGKTLDGAILPTGTAEPLVKSGRLRTLVAASKSRMVDIDAFKSTPTIMESGYPEFELTVWTGFAVKAGTPAAIVKKLEGAIMEVLRSADFRDFQMSRGGELPFIVDSKKFTQVLEKSLSDTSQVLKALESKK
jgi:tripartite-type tricarboxylate transporter receptor subunit TctC